VLDETYIHGIGDVPLLRNEEKKLCGIGNALLVQTGSAFKNKVDFLKKIIKI
jgi:hypothetical protein